MRARLLYELLLKNEKRIQLQWKCVAGGAALIVFALFFATFLGIEVVYKIKKGFGFQAATCVVEHSILLTHKNVTCACGVEGCISRYPCFKLFVNFTVKGKFHTVKHVQMYNNIYDIGSDCTYGPPCKEDEKANFDLVSEFKRKKGLKGSSFDCYANPDSLREVILDSSVHKTAAFQSLFWPSCIFLAGLCLIIKAFCLRKNMVKIFLPEEITRQWTYGVMITEQNT